MTKGKKISDDLARQIQALDAQGVLPGEIGRRVGVSQFTVYKYRRDPSTLTLPDSRVAVAMTHQEFLGLGQRGENIAVAAMVQQDSLKLRLLKAIAAEGPFADLRALTEAVRQPSDNFDQHEVTHLLFRLNKDGCIKFVERSNNGLERIEATHQGFGAAGLGTKAYKVGGARHSHRGEGGPVTVSRVAPVPKHRAELRVPAIVAEAPAPIVEEAAPVQEWPQLRQLRIRLAELERGASKAAAYYDAAAALETVDPEESARLLGRAEDVGGTPLSAVEAEYLRFADRA